MGQGRDEARKLAPEHVALLDNMRDQLLIVLLKRLGGNARIPVEEIDDTGGEDMAFSLVGRTFYFTIQKKP